MPSLSEQQSKRLKTFLQRSREVIRDCAIENGAIVAANTDKNYTPRTAADYRAVWPRDAAFVSIAAKLLGYSDIVERFLQWVDEKPEGFHKEGLLYQKYTTHGRKGGFQFQADQMGTLLWLISWFYDGDPKKAERFLPLVERLALGLTNNWNGKFFTTHVTDLWEQEHRHTSTTFENNFTYTLAACSRGLMAANDLMPNPAWQKAGVEMLGKINEAYSEKQGYFFRNHGRIDDPNVDASILGLVWPFEICKANDERMIRTVDTIERVLVQSGGVHRFQFDYYDGEGSAQEGSGAWPLLNFWMAIYWSKRSDPQKAQEYFWAVLDQIDAQEDKYHSYLPEQVFSDERVGIYPLAWSHAMFVVACHTLGYQLA